MRIARFEDPPLLVRGLADIRRAGLTPRGLLFLALEPSGAIQLAVPKNADDVARIRVGEKLSLRWSIEGRFYHFDSIHRLPGNYVVYNGDRRLQHPGDAIEVAWAIAEFLKVSSARNVFFGCTPHQPGSWLVRPRNTLALHEAGFVEVVPVHVGLLARRVMDHRLWLRTYPSLSSSDRLDDWIPIFDSPLGNILLLERRVIGGRLVLTCERGLIDLDISGLPRVEETDRALLGPGVAVIGRVENEAFAITQGKPEPWGLAEIEPAALVRAEGGSLGALAAALQASTTQL